MKIKRIVFGPLVLSLLACNFVSQMVFPPTATPTATVTATATASPTPTPTTAFLAVGSKAAGFVLLLRLLALVALYAFLGLALWIMWQTLRRASDAGGLSMVPKLHLEIRQKGQRAVSRIFSQPEVLIGRDPLSDIALNDKAVSTRHARLSYHHNQWWAEDLHSMNGTFLNDERLSVPTVIISGDELRCGKASITLTRAGKVLIRGAYLLSRSSGVNRIKGGSVQIN